jgi:hypothetical protein
LGQNENHETT